MKLTIRSLYILFVFLVSIYSVSCKKTPKPLSKEEIKRQIDSATNFRIHELYKEAQIDLERRIPIEVKAKADSIVNVRKMLLQVKVNMPVKNSGHK